MNGKKFTGALVCLHAAVCFRQQNKKKRRVSDKIELGLETLQWEDCSKSDKMVTSDVHRAKRKHCCVMHLIPKLNSDIPSFMVFCTQQT